MAFVDTTDLEDAVPAVAPYVNGAPFATILYHLREAAIEFCTRTLVWRVDLDPILTVVDQGTYALKLPDESRVVKLLRYQLGEHPYGNIVTPDKGQDLLDYNSGYDAIWTTDKLNVSVCPVPKAAGQSMAITVALRPSADALTIPEFLFEDYATCIAEGAVSRIAAIPRQSFTDLQQAAVYGAKFKDEMDRVAAAAGKGFGRSRNRSRAFMY